MSGKSLTQRNKSLRSTNLEPKCPNGTNHEKYQKEIIRESEGAGKGIKLKAIGRQLRKDSKLIE